MATVEILSQTLVQSAPNIPEQSKLTVISPFRATHSSTLAWRIPWREEPGRLQSKIAQFHLETEKQTVES